VTEQESEVRTLSEEADRGIDDSVERLERRQVTSRRFSHGAVPLIGATCADLRQQILLVLEEQVDGRCRESRQVGNLAERPVSDTVFAEDDLGRVEDLSSILFSTSGAPLCATV
jgi:hypothetical protein